MEGRCGVYPPELRERAGWLVSESRRHHDSEWAAITSVAAKLGGSGARYALPTPVAEGVRRPRWQCTLSFQV